MGIPTSLDQPGTYRICVGGRLSPRWAGYFEEMTITETTDAEGNPVTELTGECADQAAIQGVLQKLYSLGCALLRVEKV